MEPTERPRPSDDGGPDRVSTGTGGSTSPGWQSGSEEAAGAAPTWQSSPEQSSPVGATGGGWGVQGAGTAPGTAGAAPGAAGAAPGTAGYFYADVPNRAVGYIIDLIILAIIGVIVGIVLGGIIGPTASFNPGAARPEDALTVNTGAALISTIVSTVINGIYFVGSWVYMRATPGQKVLGMQVGNETDGATLTMNQAIIRWVLLGAPFGIAQALAGVSGLGVIIGLIALVWFIALLVTTAQSPTKQGLHDRYAHTVVVKAGRSVG